MISISILITTSSYIIDRTQEITTARITALEMADRLLCLKLACRIPLFLFAVLVMVDGLSVRVLQSSG